MLLTPSSPELLAIPIEDSGEPLIDVSTLGIACGPAPECELTASDYKKLRLGVCERLLIAQSSLPEGISFRLYEGYRSLAVQKLLFQQVEDQISALHPELDEQQRFTRITQIVSAIHLPDGRPICPPHSTGGAVDLELVDQQGNLLDCGMEIADWQQVPLELCSTLSTSLSETAKQNRQLLMSVMTAAGFVNYPQEWWHFSYGDRFWAHQTAHPCAIYGGL